MGGKWEFLALRIVGHQTDAGEKGSVFSQSAPLLLTLITACLFWVSYSSCTFHIFYHLLNILHSLFMQHLGSRKPMWPKPSFSMCSRQRQDRSPTSLDPFEASVHVESRLGSLLSFCCSFFRGHLSWGLTLPNFCLTTLNFTRKGYKPFFLLSPVLNYFWRAMYFIRILHGPYLTIPCWLSLSDHTECNSQFEKWFS